VASGALSGCSDDEAEPPDSGLPAKSELTESTQTSTPPSVTGPSSSDPTRSGREEPPLPAAAKAPGKAGARAFVAYYIRLLNYASHTGDGAPLLQYGPNCRLCKSQAKFAAKTYRRGGWFKGGDWRPDPRTWLVLPSGHGYFVAVNVDTASGRQLSKRGDEVTTFEADHLRISLLLRRSRPTWQVRRLGSPS
jgi:hypothetical protein